MADKIFINLSMFVTQLGRISQAHAPETGRYRRYIFVLIVLSLVWLISSPSATHAATVGQDDPVAQCAEGVRLFNEGKPAEALPLLEAGFADRTHTTFAQPNDLAVCAFGLASIRNAASDYNGALEAYAVALVIARQLGNQAGEGAILNNIGLVYNAQAKYAQALENYKQALTIYQATNDQEREIETLTNIGTAYAMQEQYIQALEIYQKALTLAQTLNDQAGEGDALNNIGLAYYNQGQPVQAIEYLQRALTIEHKLGDEVKEGVMQRSIAQVYYDQKQYTQALDAYQTALTIVHHLKDQTDESDIQRGIAQIYYDQKQYTQAMDNYQKALTIARHLKDQADEASSLNSIGNVYRAQGQYEKALDAYRNGLTILRSLDSPLGQARVLFNIGFVCHELQQYTEALDYYQQALISYQAVSDQKGASETLINIGVTYEVQGLYTQALATYQQALVLTRASNEQADEGDLLYSMGIVYYEQGQYVQALNAYQPALTISQALGNQKGEVLILDAIGSVYTEQELYAKALDYFQQALALARAISSQGGDDFAQSDRFAIHINWANEGMILADIGLLYTDQNLYNKALDFYEQALTIQRTNSDQEGEAFTLNYIGALYYQQGEFSKARTAFQQALPIWHLLRDQKSEIETLYSIGKTYDNQAEYAQALDYYQIALTLAQAIKDSGQTDNIINTLGRVYNAQGQFSLRLETYKQTMVKESTRLHNEPVAEGLMKANIASAYDAQGQYAQALDYYQQALTLFRSLGEPLGESHILNNIGVFYAHQRQYVQALDYYQQALAVEQAFRNRANKGALPYDNALDNTSLTGEGNVRENIGKVYADKEQYVEALDYYQQALTIRRSLDDQAGEIRLLLSIGMVYDHQSQYILALDTEQKAFKLGQVPGDRLAMSKALFNIGSVYEHQKQYAPALNYYQQALDMLETIRAVAGGEQSRASFIAQYASFYETAIALYHHQGQDDLAFVTSEKGRARSFLDSQATGVIQLSDQDAQIFRTREQSTYSALQSAQNALAQARIANPSNPTLIANLQQQIKDAEQQHAAALATIDQRGDQLAMLIPGRTKSVLDRAAVQKRLDAQTTLVAYEVLPDQTLAFIITHDHFQTVALSVTNTTLITQVHTLHEFSDVSEAYPASAVKLYHWLIAPLKPYLTTSHLAIVPHGVLHYLPFATLTDGKRFLIDDYTLTTLPSASSLQFIQSHPSLTNTVPLIIGNPATPDPDLKPLNFAEQEAQAIGKLYNVAPLLGAAATTTAIRQRAVHANILHLAAHGSYNVQDPLESTLYLAPSTIVTATTQVTDTSYVTETSQLTATGHLTVRDIYRWQLNATNLVVLSACETQMNEPGAGNIVSAGDDIVGLTRAFFFAGTPSVIATLWSVDDESTEQLMEHFYTNLHSGMGKAEALRQAQLTIRKDYPNPYHWAGFVLSGDGGPLSAKSPKGTH